MLEYTKSQMLALWKSLRWLEPLRADATIVRTDGTDLDILAETEMRQWYLRLLREAPVDLLPLTDIATGASVTLATDLHPLCPDPVLRILPLARPLRIISITLDNNPLPIPVITDPSDPRWRLTLNPWRHHDPVALHLTPSSSTQSQQLIQSTSSPVILCPFTPTSDEETGGIPSIRSILAVMDPGPDLYRFPEAALATILPAQ